MFNRAYPVLGDRGYDDRRAVPATQDEVLYKIAAAAGENPILRIAIGSTFAAAPAEQPPVVEAFPEDARDVQGA